MKTFLLKL